METSELVRRALLAGGSRPAVSGSSGTSRRRGEGYEFAELRGYVSGDDPRRIDWAATARAGALQTRVVLEEHALVLGAIIDSGASMRTGRERPRYDDALDAMRIWYGAARRGDRCVRIGESDVVAPRGGNEQSAAAACANAALATEDLDAAIDSATAVLPRGAALLVIGDGYALPGEAALFAASARLDATFLLARDPWQRSLDLRGIVKLRDAATGRVATLALGRDADRRYREASIAREAEIRARFDVAGWRTGVFDDDPESGMRELFAGGRGGAR